jgi:hypothetical protein
VPVGGIVARRVEGRRQRGPHLRSGPAAISRSPRVAGPMCMGSRRAVRCWSGRMDTPPGAAAAADRQTFHLLPGSQIPRLRGGLGRGDVVS